MIEVLVETGEFETQTFKQIQTPADVNYSLLEGRLEKAIQYLDETSVGLLQEMFTSNDNAIHSIAVDGTYQALAKGIETGLLGNWELDCLRNLLVAEMESDDEQLKYDAQEAFAIHEERLVMDDTTTHLWLGQHILRDWFNG